MKRFIDLKAKEIFPDLPDARKDGGVASMKQIGYVYVLAKQNNIPKEDLEKIEFRHFSISEISEFIDDIKTGKFYSKYMQKETSIAQPTLFNRAIEIDDSELPFF